MRGVPFSAKSINDIICEQLDELMYLLYDQVEEGEFNAFLTVDTCMYMRKTTQ